MQFPQIFVALDEPQAPQTFGSSAANFIATRSCAFVGVGSLATPLIDHPLVVELARARERWVLNSASSTCRRLGGAPMAV